jgi:hypothetical protein
MKNLLMIYGLLACLAQADAASVLTGATGDKYSFGDWSAPSVLKAHSSAGDIPVTFRSCGLAINSFGGLAYREIDLLINPIGQELLLCEHMDHYAVVGSHIWGIKINGRRLQIAQSDKTDSADNSPDTLISTALTKWVNSASAALTGTKPILNIDLYRVFGTTAFTTLRSEPTPVEATVVDSLVDASGMTLRMKAIKGDDLTVTLSPILEILSATKSGKNVYLLDTSFSELSNPSATFGKMNTLVSVWDYPVMADNGDGRISAMAEISTETGELWIGPGAHMAEIGGKLVGIEIPEESGDLLLYLGRGVKLPLTTNCASVYQQEVAKFNDELKANKYHFTPSVKISINELLAGDTTFHAGQYFGYRRHSIKNGNLVIQCNCGVNCPEITLDSNLRVVSTRVLYSGDKDL